MGKVVMTKADQVDLAIVRALREMGRPSARQIQTHPGQGTPALADAGATDSGVVRRGSEAEVVGWMCGPANR